MLAGAFMQDVRYAARALGRARGLTTVIVLTLTLGISANAIMFGVVDQLLLRPPSAIGHADDVRRVYFMFREGPRSEGADRHSYPFVAAVRDHVPAFSTASAISRSDVTIGAGPTAREASVELVNASYFPLLELVPVDGRFFTASDDGVPDGAPVAVLSHGFWMREYAGDQRAIGQDLRVEDVRLTIVGVAPAGFSGLGDRPTDFWVPIGALAPALLGPTWPTNPSRWAFSLVARLSPGATTDLADTQATAAMRRMLADNPDLPFNKMGSAFTAPLTRLDAPGGVPDEGRIGLWLMGVAAVVLLVAIANVASLLLTRMLARRREIAMRLALGVSRRRLLRQLLTESALLASLGATVALLVAYLGGQVVQQTLLPGFAWDGGVVDQRVFGVTLALTMITALVAGLAPALNALSTDVLESLRTSTRVASGRTGWLRSGLLVTQVALSVVLLVGAGLFARSLSAVRANDVGIDLDRVIMARLTSRPGVSLTEMEAEHALAIERLEGIPGIERVTLTRGSAPMGNGSSTSVLLAGETLSDLNGVSSPGMFIVGPDYFATLGAVVEQGRNVTTEDERTQARVAVVNRAMAETRWLGANPIGQCIYFGSDRRSCTEVVGIVQNILRYDRTDTSDPQLFLPVGHPSAAGKAPTGLFIRAASASDARTLVPTVRSLLQSLTPDMPFVVVDTMEALAAPQLQPWRLGTTMFMMFGGMALLMAAIGLYSSMAHAVSQRRQEIGIRMALGASRRHVVARIGLHGGVTVAVGIAIGLLIAAGATRWLTDLLYQTSPRDPFVFAAVAAVLAVAGVAAAIVPARRSASVNPLETLRTE